MAEERAGLAEKLRQAQRMSKVAKEEGEEQRCKAQEAERQLDGLGKENEELCKSRKRGRTPKQLSQLHYEARTRSFLLTSNDTNPCERTLSLSSC